MVLEHDINNINNPNINNPNNINNSNYIDILMNIGYSSNLINQFGTPAKKYQNTEHFDNNVYSIVQIIKLYIDDYTNIKNKVYLLKNTGFLNEKKWINILFESLNLKFQVI